MGDIEGTSNAPIPGSVIQPGLEIVIELGSSRRLPASGRRPEAVVDIPPFNLTVVPLFRMNSPVTDLVSTVQSLTEDSEYFNASKAHELGHNLNMLHAPCGTSSFLEHAYPYSDGSIGVWGVRS